MTSRPLKPQLFHILLALAEGALHGYGIQRSVLDRTDGGLMLWPATLYRMLTQLESDGLIEAAAKPAAEPEDERRQYYALTKAGRKRLRAEADDMARWAASVRQARTG